MLSLRGQAVLLFCTSLVACHTAGPTQTGALTTAAAVHRLSTEEASTRPQVHLSGTITVIDEFSRIMFVQDGTGAVWTTMPPGMPNLPGNTSIELSGTAAEIGQDRAVIYPSVTRLGLGTEPQHRQISRADLTAERKNYALGVLRLRIKEMLPAAGREIRLTGEMNGGLVEVTLLHPPSVVYGNLIGQEVDLAGVPAPPTQVSASGLPLFLANFLDTVADVKPSSEHLKVLTTVREVKSLDSIEARRAYPVALHGVVTTSVPAAYMLTIQDETGAIYLSADPRGAYPPQGCLIRVEGTTSPGDAAPSIAVTKIVREGRAAMPAPVDLEKFEINDIRLDNLWAHLDGVVRWMAPDPAGGYQLVMATPRFRTTVNVRSGSAAEAALYVPGTTITLDGTYSPRADRFRHWRDFEVFTPSFNLVRIRRPAPGAHDEPQVSEMSLSRLFYYGTVSSPTTPTRLRGVVTLRTSDGNFYVSDGQGGVLVVPVADQKPVKPGMFLELTGFLPHDPVQRRIEDATWTVLGERPPPEAPVIQPESALDGSYESHWVRMEGRLTHRQQAVEANILVLESPSVLVDVYSTAAPDAAWAGLRMGSLLMVRGVVRPSIDRTGLIGSRTVRVLVNSSQDIQVIEMASWWTPEHLTATLVVSSALLFALLLFASMLVRRVWSQSEIIVKKLEAEAALKAEAQAASRAKSQFLASMSHEIRTPMNGVLGLTELALQSVGHPEQVSFLQNALQSARSLMGILNDVLDLAKIESGKMTLGEERFCFEPVLQPIVAAAVQQCKAKGVEFVCEVDPDVPEMVIGDAKRLQQIVSNLVSNACKFTHEGKVEVHASAEGAAGEQFTLVLHVHDTGIGIADDQLSRVFGDFKQADRSDSRRYEGTGLGLAICLRLAHLMGGTITVDSKLGRGSDFCVRVPLRSVPKAEAVKSPAAAAPSPNAATPEQGSFRPLKILVAEDNRVNRLLLGRILEKAGHHAVFAENGVEALQLWEVGGFDLVLMDLQMPVMDGLEATRELRKREAGRQYRTPIVAVTARAMHADRNLTIAAGMDGYVSKPYSADDILTAIKLAMWQRDGAASDGFA